MTETINHWLAELPARRPSPILVGAHCADLVVVGAGLVGLAAARRFAELAPSAQVILLDAGKLAQGSAGCNSGFVIDAPLSHAMHHQASLGRNSTVQYELSQHCYRWLEGLVQRHRIDCGWSRVGRYYAAATSAGMQALANLPRQFEAMGEACETLARDEVIARLGTRYYQGAVFNGSCTLVQPAVLVRGLGDHLPANVRLHECTRVLEWRRERRMHMVRAAQGSARAPRIIWATHTDLARFTPLGRHYMPLYTYAGVTPRLTREQLGAGELPEWGVLPALRAGSTVRRLPEGRILLRSLWSYHRRLGADELRTRLLPLVAKRFPQATSLGLERVWGGPVAITRGAQAFFGEFEPGAYGFTGDNGSGLIKASAYGLLMAEMASGHESSLLRLACAEPQAGWIPPGLLRRIAVAYSLARNTRTAGAEI